MKIEDIKRDREAGTPGDWAKMAQDIYSPAIANRGNTGMVAEVTVCDEWEHNSRRIARVPELEAAFLEAVELLSEVAEGMDMATHDDVLVFLERFK